MKGSVAHRLSHIRHRMRELGITEHNKIVKNIHRITAYKMHAWLAYYTGWFVGAICVFAVFVYVLKMIIILKIPLLPDFVVDILNVIDMRRNGNWSW